MLEWMSTLEWMFVVEAVLMLSAGLFWLISLSMAREAPNDPFVVYFRTFWKILLRRRMALSAAVSALDADKAREYEQLKESGNVEGIKELLREESDQEEFGDTEIEALVAEARKNLPEEGSEEAPPPAVVTITVTVVPFSPRDELVTFSREGAVIKVTSGPEEGQANKAVVDLISAMLAVKPYQLTLVKGHYRANKVVQIAGLDEETVYSRGSAFS